MGRPKKLREYKLTEIKSNVYRVKITYKGVKYIDMQFDINEKSEAIKSIDRTILKYRLPYKTKANYKRI